MNIVKAEILWTRKCPLNCSYCAMADGRINTIGTSLWYHGIDNLKKVGCQFIAFYGAEPLSDFDKLPDVIRYTENKGISTTVITSGVVDHLNEKLNILYECGLRSITTSYDHFSLDKSSSVKSSRALHVINAFRGNGPVKNAAVVMTLTRKNFMYLPEVISEMSSRNIWTFFDFIHADRGQPGCKVKTTDLDLMFTPEDHKKLCDVLIEVSLMKSKGFLCHTSKSFMGYVLSAGVNYNWNCAFSSVFPSWVTVDCDGLLYPCDDYQRRLPNMYYIWELCKNQNDIVSQWKDDVMLNCPGCMWNTHIDAHMIKLGEEKITDYIHND